MNKRYELRLWSDDSIGCGLELWFAGEYVGTSQSIALLRKWARQCWQSWEFLHDCD